MQVTLPAKCDTSGYCEREREFPYTTPAPRVVPYCHLCPPIFSIVRVHTHKGDFRLKVTQE